MGAVRDTWSVLLLYLCFLLLLLLFLFFDPWYGLSCCSNIFPFETKTNKDFVSSILTTNSFSQGANSDNDKESLLSLKPPSDLALLYNQFNNTSPEKNNDPENVVNSKFYDIDQIQTLKFPDKANLPPYPILMHAL